MSLFSETAILGGSYSGRIYSILAAKILLLSFYTRSYSVKLRHTQLQYNEEIVSGEGPIQAPNDKSA